MTCTLLPDTGDAPLVVSPGLVHAEAAREIAGNLLALPSAQIRQAIEASRAPPELWMDLALLSSERGRADMVTMLVRRCAASVGAERECKLACLRLLSNALFVPADALMKALIELHGPLPLLIEWQQVARRYYYRHTMAELPVDASLPVALDRLATAAAVIADDKPPFAIVPVVTTDNVGTPVPSGHDAPPVALEPSRPLHVAADGELAFYPTPPGRLDAGPFVVVEDVVVTGGAHPLQVAGKAIADDVMAWMNPREFNPFGSDSAYSGLIYRYACDDAGNRQAIIKRRPPERTLARGILLNGPHQSNFYHWLAEHLIRVPFLDDLPPAYADWPLLICRDALSHPNLAAALELAMGGRPRPVILLGKGETVHVDSLLVPPRLTRIRACVQWQRHEHPGDCLLAGEGVRRLHDRLALPARPRRRLFLERSGSARLINQDEIRRFLETRGFETIHPARLDFATARQVYAEAEVVVCAAGAALANLLLCPPTCTVLVLTYELCRGCGVFSALATPLGQTLVNICEDGLQPDTLEPFTIRPELVAQVLQALNL